MDIGTYYQKIFVQTKLVKSEGEGLVLKSAKVVSVR